MERNSDKSFVHFYTLNISPQSFGRCLLGLSTDKRRDKKKRQEEDDDDDDG